MASTQMSAERHTVGPLAFLARFWSSSIGKKIVMAVTGIIMWGFVIGHMAGNMLVFMAAGEGAYAFDEWWGQSINEYAQFLKDTPLLVWGTRAVLLVSLVLHVVAGIQLAAANRAARPDRYVGAADDRRSTVWSRTMPVTGLIVLAFIILHLAHFTFGVIEPSSFAGANLTHDMPDVYNMIRTAFRNPAWVAIYVVCNTLLVAHLVHGTQSVWQTFGLHHPSWTPLFRRVGWLTVALILAGNLSIPLVLYAWALQGH